MIYLQSIIAKTCQRATRYFKLTSNFKMVGLKFLWRRKISVKLIFPIISRKKNICSVDGVWSGPDHFLKIRPKFLLSLDSWGQSSKPLHWLCGRRRLAEDGNAAVFQSDGRGKHPHRFWRYFDENFGNHCCRKSYHFWRKQQQPNA